MKKYNVILKLMKEAWNIDKKYFLFLVLSIIFESSISIFSLYIPAMIIDWINLNNTFEEILYSLISYFIIIYVLKQIQEFVNMKFSEKSVYQNKRLEAKLSEKSLNIVYEKLEDPNSLDLIQRAQIPISWGYIQLVLNSVKDILTLGFTVIGLISILFIHSFTYGAVIILILILSMTLRFKYQREYDKYLQQNVPYNRKASYYLNKSFSENYQKEFRIFGLSDLIYKNQVKFDKQVIKWVSNLYKLESKMGNVEAISTSIITFISISYNSIRLFSDKLGPKIGIGSFTLIYNSTDKILKNILEIASKLSWINSSVVNLTPWKEFIELEDEEYKGELDIEDFESLEFRNVSFTYPNSNDLILDNISFKINKGEKISIVGLNNAGKSTIVKLICRFYSPDKGQILWNDIDIKKYDYEKYIDQISAVFQDFKLFPYTIFENIMTKLDDRKKAEESLKKVKMYDNVFSLKNGMDTYLSKELEEDATKFSGGQNQKLAIARAINNDGSLMILDEPTAALDPLAESEIFENFEKLTKNKTAIFISHRMSSSTFSDKVLLIENKRVTAFEKHSELMKKHNTYRELFETQAKNYA